MSQMIALYVPDGAEAPPTGLPLAGGAVPTQVRCTSDGKVLQSGVYDGPGGSGDASAANQTTQIAAEQATAAALGTTADAAPASLAATGSVPAWLRWLARGIGAPTDAAAASGTGLIGLVQALLARWPSALGATTAAQSVPVTLASDGALVTAVGTTTASAPTDGATSGTLIGWLRAAVETLRARLPSLVSGRIPVDIGVVLASASITTVITDLSGLAANTTAYSSIIDLGAVRGSVLGEVAKLLGANQGDVVMLTQSTDQVTWYYVSAAFANPGTTTANSSTASTTISVLGRPSMRYVRAQINTAPTLAQPAGARLVLCIHPGV